MFIFKETFKKENVGLSFQKDKKKNDEENKKLRFSMLSESSFAVSIGTFTQNPDISIRDDTFSEGVNSIDSGTDNFKHNSSDNIPDPDPHHTKEYIHKLLIIIGHKILEK